MGRSRAGFLLLTILIFSLLTIPICKVAAPPLSYGYTSGLITNIDADVLVSHSEVNITISPCLAAGENLTHRVEITSTMNLTNTAEHEVGLFVANVRNLWSPNIEFENNPNNITIDGNSSLYNASIMYNLSTQSDLPEGIGSRFQEDYFESFTTPLIDVVTISLAAGAVLLVSAQTAFDVNCFGNYFDLRYGLDMQNFNTDSTIFDGRLIVTNTTLLVRTDFLNSHSRSVNEIGVSSVATWSLSEWDWGGEDLYPGLQFDEDVFTEYIGVQLWQSEYIPPTYDPFPDFDGLPLFFMIGVAAIFIFVVAMLRWGSRN